MEKIPVPLGVPACVMRFVNNTLVKKELRQTGSLTATELRAA